MQKLTKDGVVESDNWIVLNKEAPIDLQQLKSENVFIYVADYLANSEQLKAQKNLGVWLDSSDNIELIQDFIDDIPSIAINFPAFADGRGFSLSQQLKEDYGYKGEILAIGNFMDEQLFYLKRCGVDSFATSDESDIETMQTILNDFSNNYQGSPTEPKPLFRRR